MKHLFFSGLGTELFQLVKQVRHNLLLLLSHFSRV